MAAEWRLCTASRRALSCPHFQRRINHRRQSSTLRISPLFIVSRVAPRAEPARHSRLISTSSDSPPPPSPPPPFAHVAPASDSDGWIPRVEHCLAAHPALSVLVFGASDAACVLGLSAALQAAQVPLAPEWLIAAALSEAVKHPIQLAALGAVTPLVARAFPALTRMRIGTVARHVSANVRASIAGAFASARAKASDARSEANIAPAATLPLHPQSTANETSASQSKLDASSLRFESVPSGTAAPASSAATTLAASAAAAANASAPTVHWAERLANSYGAAAFVSKNLLSLLTRAALFGVLCAGGTAADALTTWMREHALIDSVIVKQVRAMPCIRMLFITWAQGLKKGSCALLIFISGIDGERSFKFYSRFSLARVCSTLSRPTCCLPERAGFLSHARRLLVCRAAAAASHRTRHICAAARACVGAYSRTAVGHDMRVVQNFWRVLGM